jgi:lipopolysaccharide export system permease protein
MLSRIQRYILKECLSGLVLVLGVLLLAILLIDVVEQLRTVGGDVSLSLLSALRLSLMKLPLLIEQTLPFALLAASMLAFTRLNRRSELSIIRASGLSAWRFLTGAQPVCGAPGAIFRVRTRAAVADRAGNAGGRRYRDLAAAGR